MPESSLAPRPSPVIITRKFAPGGGIPNNTRLPLVIYRNALAADRPRLAAELEMLIRDNGWGGVWRWTVYDFHHFHANAHEMLAVLAGSACLQFGGEDGEALEVAPGDVVFIPAGLGHKRLSATGDFQVVGAYPPGQVPDMHREDVADGAGLAEKIERVPLPAADPIYGTGGPLVRLWKS